MQAAWTEVVACAEVELCGLCDTFKSGAPDSRFMGRANGARVVKTWSLPPRSAGKEGGMDIETYAYSWTATRLRELAHLGRKAGKGWEWDDEARARQWAGLKAKFIWPSPFLRQATATDNLLRECVNFAAQGTVSDWRVFEEWADWAAVTTRRRKAAAMEGARQAWRAFIQKDLAKGGGSLHAFAKRSEEHQGESVADEVGRSGTPQDIVLAEAEEWESIWHRFQGTCAAPWREADLRESERLPRPTVSELRRCAGTFRTATAVGCDSFFPRWFAWLSDELLEAIIDFLTTVEALGLWPREVASSIIHLIPKASGGRRPIGVMASVIRLWEAARKPVIWQWRAKNARPYNWAAAGRSAEAAIWGQTVRDEVAQAKGKSCGAVLFDLVKAYEYVRLELVWEAGMAAGFPALVLRLLMESFAFARTLIYRGALAKGITTLSAILAGSVFAMDALALVLTGVVDKIAVAMPSISFVLYVDDLTARARGDGKRSS